MIHNHGSEDGEGLGCPELRRPDGSLKGKCLVSHGNLTRAEVLYLQNLLHIWFHVGKLPGVLKKSRLVEAKGYLLLGVDWSTTFEVEIEGHPARYLKIIHAKDTSDVEVILFAADSEYNFEMEI